MMNEIEMMMKNTPVALAYLVSNSSFFPCILVNICCFLEDNHSDIGEIGSHCYFDLGVLYG
jgi:hypothetical protein